MAGSAAAKAAQSTAGAKAGGFSWPSGSAIKAITSTPADWGQKLVQGARAAGIPVDPQTQQTADQQAALPYLSALHQQALQRQAASAGGATQQPAAPAPTASDYINAILGARPTTVSNGFDASPYNQALAALASGKTSGTADINAAYAAAQQQDAAQNAIENQQLASYAQESKTDAANAQAQMGALAAQVAKQFNGAGAPNAQADFLANQTAGQQMQAAQLNQAKLDQGTMATALSGNHQGALDSLAAAISAATNQINFQKASDQSKANAAAAAALDTAQKNWDASRTSLLKDAYTNANTNAPTNLQAAQATLGDWGSQGSQGNQNAEALASVANGILYGKHLDGSTINDQATGKPVGGVNGLAEAMGRLNSPSTLATVGGQGSIMYKIIAGMLNQYYMGGKTQGDPTSYLKYLATMGQ